MKNFDIDIDIKPDTDPTRRGTRCSIWDTDNESVSPHPSGYILGTQPPTDPLTGLCSIDFREVEDFGFHKIDLINNNYLKHFTNKEEFIQYMNQEPDWGQLLNQETVQKLPHINNHFDLIQEVQPSSIEELADCLALIRPQKRHLLQDYRTNPKETRKYLYQKTNKDDGSFKKSHAINYSFLIIAVLNKITDSNNQLIVFD